MSPESISRSLAVNFAPQTYFSYPNKADGGASREPPPPQTDAVDLSTRNFNHETRFEINPETNKVVVKVVDKDTKEVLRKISDKGVEVLSNAVGSSAGRAFHELTV